MTTTPSWRGPDVIPIGRGHHRWVIWVASKIPQRLLAAPDRVLINFALLLIGFQAFSMQRVGTPLGDWPNWLRVEWAIGMTLAGMLTLYGHWVRQRIPERVGNGLAIIGCLLYSAQILLDFHGQRGTVSAVIFIFIAIAKGVWLIRSIAYTSTASHHLEGWSFREGEWEPPSDEDDGG